MSPTQTAANADTVVHSGTEVERLELAEFLEPPDEVRAGSGRLVSAEAFTVSGAAGAHGDAAGVVEARGVKAVFGGCAQPEATSSSVPPSPVKPRRRSRQFCTETPVPSSFTASFL